MIAMLLLPVYAFASQLSDDLQLPASFGGGEVELAALSQSRMRALGFSIGARNRVVKWQKQRLAHGDSQPRYTAAGPTGPRVRPVPRHQWDSLDAQKLLGQQKPVILTGTDFARYASEKWSPAGPQPVIMGCVAKEAISRVCITIT